MLTFQELTKRDVYRWIFRFLCYILVKNVDILTLSHPVYLKISKSLNVEIHGFHWTSEWYKYYYHQWLSLLFAAFMNVICFYSILWQSDRPCFFFTTAALPHFANTVLIWVHKTVKAVICWIKFHFTNHYFQLPLFHLQSEQNMSMKM